MEKVIPHIREHGTEHRERLALALREGQLIYVGQREKLSLIGGAKALELEFGGKGMHIAQSIRSRRLAANRERTYPSARGSVSVRRG
jgi:hypothetical protein